MKLIINYIYYIVLFISLSEVCNTENIEGFPTFKLYIGDKFLAEYNGGRTEKELLNYLTNSPEVKKDEL